MRLFDFGFKKGREKRLNMFIIGIIVRIGRAYWLTGQKYKKNNHQKIIKKQHEKVALKTTKNHQNCAIIKITC